MIAQGINQVVTLYKQTGLGVPRSGAGGQAMRRETSNGTLNVATYANNEITSHQQSTGKTHGGRSATFALNGLLSGGTYAAQFASIMRAPFAAVPAFAATTITITGTPALYTFTSTIGTPAFLTNGLKIGDVVALSAAGGAAGNKAHNILVFGVESESVFTGITINDSPLTLEAIAACTVTVRGKKCVAPLTGQTAEYWTGEHWQSDISQSELFTDMVFGSADITISSSANATVVFNALALDRVPSGAQVLTSPIAETTSEIVRGVKSLVVVNGVVVGTCTTANLKIDGTVAALANVLGRDTAPDISRSILNVSGTFTAFYEDGTLSGYFDNATNISLMTVVPVDDTNASEFITFIQGSVQLDGDAKDAGAAGMIRTYPYTAKLNPLGGAALANAKTILSIQDSLA